MKIAAILLTLNRSDLTKRVIAQNLYNASHPFDLIWVDNGSTDLEFTETVKAIGATPKVPLLQKENLGISHGQNIGIEYAMREGYDAVVLMSNDILMPSGWLYEMVNYHKAIPQTGTIGIFCVEGREDFIEVNGKELHPTATAFGNIYIPREVIEKVGYQNTDFGFYGMSDADFGYRVRKAGFINYYLYGIKSEHIGHDVGMDSEYRKMKDEGLAKAGEIYQKWINYYDRTGNIYLPCEQENYIINQQQYAEV